MLLFEADDPDHLEDVTDWTDPKLAANPLIFPTDEELGKLSIFKALNDEEETQYAQDYQAIAV